ncbi:MAG: hypothetical protein BWY72_00224 [Bacteroidetes bacterium ADurb.Bin416]|nr:MAG: hypothetical protein BWY72_00224 [Bacteroidetes bacterium ADurb.Bin416]
MFKPFSDILTQVSNHSGDAGIAELLTVNFSENLANLALRHAATVKTANQSFAIDFLITQQSQYLRM